MSNVGKEEHVSSAHESQASNAEAPINTSEKKEPLPIPSQVSLVTPREFNLDDSVRSMSSDLSDTAGPYERNPSTSSSRVASPGSSSTRLTMSTRSVSSTSSEFMRLIAAKGDKINTNQAGGGTSNRKTHQGKTSPKLNAANLKKMLANPTRSEPRRPHTKELSTRLEVLRKRYTRSNSPHLQSYSSGQYTLQPIVIPDHATVEDMMNLRGKNEELQKLLEAANDQSASGNSMNGSGGHRALLRQLDELRFSLDNIGVGKLQRQITRCNKIIQLVIDRNKWLAVEIRRNIKKLKAGNGNQTNYADAGHDPDISIEQQKINLTQELKNDKILVNSAMEKTRVLASTVAEQRNNTKQNVAALRKYDTVKGWCKQDIRLVIDLHEKISKKFRVVRGLHSRLRSFKCILKNVGRDRVRKDLKKAQKTELNNINEEIQKLRELIIDEYVPQTPRKKHPQVYKRQKSISATRKAQEVNHSKELPIAARRTRAARDAAVAQEEKKPRVHSKPKGIPIVSMHRHGSDTSSPKRLYADDQFPPRNGKITPYMSPNSSSYSSSFSSTSSSSGSASSRFSSQSRVDGSSRDGHAGAENGYQPITEIMVEGGAELSVASNSPERTLSRGSCPSDVNSVRYSSDSSCLSSTQSAKDDGEENGTGKHTEEAVSEDVMIKNELETVYEESDDM